MDQLQRPVQVRGGFDVDSDVVGAGIGERGNLPLGVLDHQVHIDDPAGRVHLIGQRLDDQRPHGDRRHEMAVHHVDVDDPCPGGHHLLDLGSQTREVGRQDRRGHVAPTDDFLSGAQTALSMLPWQ